MASKPVSSFQKETTRETVATKKKQTRTGKQADKSDRVSQEASAGQKRGESSSLSHEQISERAKAIWQRSGCPTGQDVKNWLEAEKELKTELGVR